MRSVAAAILFLPSLALAAPLTREAAPHGAFVEASIGVTATNGVAPILRAGAGWRVSPGFAVVLGASYTQYKDEWDPPEHLPGLALIARGFVGRAVWFDAGLGALFDIKTEGPGDVFVAPQVVLGVGGHLYRGERFTLDLGADLGLALVGNDMGVFAGAHIGGSFR